MRDPMVSYGRFILTCFNKNDQKIFLLAYGATAYYFANRMMRLMIIAGPAASALTGEA